ncbi:HEAT repeat domain-containing protein [candidate division CSSED10-310 bacterium]|uniref:HEAT repeat domain-containing protein n=1 Tax=candidate division CSSED10-310 bacterium TaxID=2855610 RepID=A0ABV6Z4G0_UNCC1
MNLIRLIPFFFWLTVITVIPYPVYGAARQGALISLQTLSPADQESLITAIQRARKDYPTIFTAVSQIRENLPQLDRVKRGLYPVITPLLKSLGPEALYPVLERIAVSDVSSDDLTDSAWSAWRASLLEAAGMCRDERAEPVLRAVLQSNQDEFLIIQAAAAYGKLASDQVVDLLINMSAEAGPKQLAILAGMGHCRRLVIAQRLAEILAEKPEKQTALVVAQSLGRVGSAWAWQTEVIARCHEEVPTRTLAARALITAFTSYDRDVRIQITHAILVVDHPSTLDFIREQKHRSSPELHPELDELRNRFQKSPLRVKSK